MKARVKARINATGEIIEVQRLCMSSEGDIWQAETGQEYLDWMLDFDFKEEPTPEYNPDYWTRLEHQYAGMAMQGMLSNTSLITVLFDATKDHDELLKEVVICSHEYAHALVEKMKEERK